MPSELVLSVTKLNEYVKSLLSMDPLLRRLSIRGEISGFKRHSSGHLYFSLKDAGALIRCVMFAGQAYKLNIRPSDGMRVVLTGNVSLYERDGQYQFYADGMRPDGVGELFMAFERLKAKLSAEGLFDLKRAALPLRPRRIALITSPTGAVVQDFLRVSGIRDRGVDVVIIPVRVQGEDAAGEIAAALRRAQAVSGVDVVVLARGGGSIEDLWAFNEEVVARAIAKCALPVVSAIGHETDYTIADFVADVRAATPTQAAEMTVPDAVHMLEAVRGLRTDLRRALEGALSVMRRRFDGARHALLNASPAARLRDTRHTAALLTMRMENAMNSCMDALRSRLRTITVHLAALAPEHTLARGYAIVSAGGKALTGAAQAVPGVQINVAMRDGAFDAVVSGKDG